MLAKYSCPGRIRATCSYLIPLALSLCNEVNGPAELCCNDLAFTAGHYHYYLLVTLWQGPDAEIQPPSAAYYKFTKKAPGLLLEAFLMERFYGLDSWLTSAAAEVVCLKP